ncbi:MAG: hypothetical protein WBP81_15710 [Solirubrobacteraceae bacterium]
MSLEAVAADAGTIPAIGRLDGLLGYYAGASPEGSMAHVSVWDQLRKGVDSRDRVTPTWSIECTL